MSLVTRMDHVQGLLEKAEALGAPGNSPAPLRAAAGEMILEGLHATDKISRSEERGFSATERGRGGSQDLYRDYQMERNRYKKPLN
jgi:magnesium chelatase subunit I